MKILTIIGARPQIIKAAALSRAIRNHFADRINEVIVHTGQHYDKNMSQVFIDELEIPAPDYNLQVGSASHGKQTAAMIEGIEDVINKERPDCLVVYGDTNSTLAAAVAASKIHVPVVHIEAGLRSFNKSMPEEINRIACDHVSTLLFTPTKAGFENLQKEGFNLDNQPPYSIDHPKVYHCGDVMYDNSLHFAAVADEKTTIINDLGLEHNGFVLATIHRDNNTDDPERLNALMSAVCEIATDNKMRVVLPLHPRTAKLLQTNLRPDLLKLLEENELISIIPPVSFLEMVSLEQHAKIVMTDSGGVQKEAFFFKKPCLILRSETEWVELVQCGAAKITGADKEKIMEAYNYFKDKPDLEFPPVFGDGKAAEFICQKIVEDIVHG